MKESNIWHNTVNWIVLKNPAGDNLLDPSVANHYVHEDFSVFALDTMGNKHIVLNNSIESTQQEPYYFIRMVDYGINSKKVNQSTVYVQLSGSDVDTLKVEYKIVDGNLSTTKLWYNGELKWTREDDKIVEIIKK